MLFQNVEAYVFSYFAIYYENLQLTLETGDIIEIQKENWGD